MRILMVVEAAADARTVAVLADRVLVERSPAWVDDDLLPYLRDYIGEERDAELRFETWTGMRKKGPRVLGHGPAGSRKHPYAAAARRAVLFACRLPKSEVPDAVVLVCDADAEPERLLGLGASAKEAVEEFGVPVAVGMPVPKREAWVLNAFEGDHLSELRRRRLQRELGFDPVSEAHRLRGDRRRSDSHRDIKAVMAELIGVEVERQIEVLRSCPLSMLEHRGRHTQLSAFLDELEKLVSLFKAPRV